MQLRFPDLTIFVAAIQADPALIAAVQQVVIAEIEYEVSAILASPQYASALVEFLTGSHQEQLCSQQHAQRIISETRVSTLIASNAEISQADQMPSRSIARQQKRQKLEAELEEYNHRRQQEQDRRQERRARAMEYLQEGLSIAKVAEKIGVSDTTISRWRTECSALGQHIPYVHTRKLTFLEEERLLEICLAQLPSNFGLAFERWTIEAICELARQDMGKTLSLEIAQAFLAKLSAHQTAALQPHASSSTSSAPHRPPPRTAYSRADTTPYSRPTGHFLAYSAEVKAQALALLSSGLPTRQVEAQFTIPKQTLRRWRREQQQSSNVPTALSQIELSALIKIINTQTPSDHGIEAEDWFPEIIVVLVATRFGKSFTTIQITEILSKHKLTLPTTEQNADDSTPILSPHQPSSPAATAGIDFTEEVTPSTSPRTPTAPPEQSSFPPAPSSPSSWMPDDELLDWIAESSVSTHAQAAASVASASVPIPVPSTAPPEEDPLAWISDDQLTDWIAGNDQACAQQPEDSNETTEPVMGNQDLLTWLLDDND